MKAIILEKMKLSGRAVILSKKQSRAGCSPEESLQTYLGSLFCKPEEQTSDKLNMFIHNKVQRLFQKVDTLEDHNHRLRISIQERDDLIYNLETTHENKLVL